MKRSHPRTKPVAILTFRCPKDTDQEKVIDKCLSLSSPRSRSRSRRLSISSFGEVTPGNTGSRIGTRDGEGKAANKACAVKQVHHCSQLELNSPGELCKPM